MIYYCLLSKPDHAIGFSHTKQKRYWNWSFKLRHFWGNNYFFCFNKTCLKKISIITRDVRSAQDFRLNGGKLRDGRKGLKLHLIFNYRACKSGELRLPHCEVQYERPNTWKISNFRVLHRSRILVQVKSFNAALSYCGAPQYTNTTILLLRHSPTAALSYCGTLLLQHSPTAALRSRKGAPQ